MFRKKEEPIGRLLVQALRQQGLESPLQEYRLLAAWGEVAGAVAEKATRNLTVRNQILYVELSSSVLRSELSMKKRELIDALNAKAGGQVITNIVFR